MAIIFESWAADGKGQMRVDHIRSDIPDWSIRSQEWLETQKRNHRCVLITKSRTDHQSNISHTLWTRPGYVDPCI